jgi:hypothetical protein
VELIAHIIWLLSRGMDPTQFLEEKIKEKALAEEMKNKYGTDKGSRESLSNRLVTSRQE